jgi:hypothetical protein
MVNESRVFHWRAALLWPGICAVALFAAVYGTVCGRGFISDDYAWIRHGRVDGLDDLAHIFGSSVGFYRPLVSLSFGLNYQLFGLSAFGYGLMNLALALACAVGVIALARELKLPARAAVTAAVLWLFNFHGINMSILWLSGRTSLLLTVFGLFAAVAFLRNRTWIGTVASLAAMLSKEEAVLLPLLFSLWAFFVHRHRASQWWWKVIPLWAALGGYVMLRASSGAMWPGSAPEYYQPTLQAAHVARNIAEYADRSMTFCVLAVFATWVAACRRVELPRLDSTVVRLCASWFLCGFAITVFLPVRSSLYAVFPSVAVAIVAATVVETMVSSQQASRRLQLAWLGVCVLVLLVPVYRSRNVRWTALAELSSSVVSQLTAAEPRLPHPTTIIIRDDEASRASLTNAWASLAPDMSFLTFHGRLEVRVVKAHDPANTAGHSITVQLSDGRLLGLPER